jgi:hypothetical protein
MAMVQFGWRAELASEAAARLLAAEALSLTVISVFVNFPIKPLVK